MRIDGGRRALCVLLLALLAVLASGGCLAGSANAYSAGCGEVPIVPGIPPWGFHTGSPDFGSSGSFARGHGEISLGAKTLSGIICQERRFGGPTRAITMTVAHHLDYYSHVAVMWGYPGNEIKFHVRVVASSDPQCKIGTVGLATVFGSYNGVRSDSVQFSFPKACTRQNHLYHGTQVNVQVPPA